MIGEGGRVSVILSFRWAEVCQRRGLGQGTQLQWALWRWTKGRDMCADVTTRRRRQFGLNFFLLCLLGWGNAICLRKGTWSYLGLSWMPVWHPSSKLSQLYRGFAAGISVPPVWPRWLVGLPTRPGETETSALLPIRLGLQRTGKRGFFLCLLFMWLIVGPPVDN